MATAGPPGGLGDEGRAVVEPVAGGELTGELERGEDCVRGRRSAWCPGQDWCCVVGAQGVSIKRREDHGMQVRAIGEAPLSDAPRKA